MKKYAQNVHVALAIVFLAGLFCFQATAQTFANLHSFSPFDGTYPQAGVIISNGVLYGTTREGGNENPGEDGAIFRMNSDGSGFTKALIYIITPKS